MATSFPGPSGYYLKWRLSNHCFEKYPEGPGNEAGEMLGPNEHGEARPSLPICS